MTLGKSEPHAIFQLKSPWENGGHTIWLATVLSVARNLNKHKFSAKLNKGHQQQLVSLLYEHLSGCSELSSPQLFRSEELTPLQKEFLLEHFLIQDGFYQAHAGEGFVIDKTGQFLAVLNLQNHLQLNFLDTQQEIEKSWNQLVKVEGFLGKSVDFAYQPRFGFLTADPRHAGTAFTISLHLHIPATIHIGELSELLEREKEEEVEVLGLQGKANELIGDILVARNTCTIGLTEEYALTTMRMWATRAVVTEINMRKHLIETNNEQMKNKVARALGLLTHSYRLEAVEALNALSLVKLGLELGWIQAPQAFNSLQLLFNCRRAHLINLLEEKVEIPDLPRKRVEYLHRMTKDLVLTI